MRKLYALLLVLVSTCIPQLAPASEPVDPQYIEDTLILWTHQSREAMHPWAEAIAAVCSDRDECDLLASQAFVESRFMPWVVDQRCNDDAWRSRQTGWIRASCDGGKAFGPWQVQDEAFRGASPVFQAQRALEWMRSRPRAWTTWKAARSHAAWWRQRLSVQE
jgi:hypothetical protein